MTPKERILSAFQGKKPDHLPCAIAYPEIPFRDRSEEHMTHPWWILDEMNKRKMIPAVRNYLQKIGCDGWPVLWTNPQKERAAIQYIRENGRDYIFNRQSGQKKELFPPGRGQTTLEALTEPKPLLHDEEYINRISIVNAENQIQHGQWEFAQATLRALGNDYFIYSYTSTPFALSFAKGFTETLMDVVTNPDFIHAIADHLVAAQRENLRAMAISGVHGVWMQDFYGGKEILSRRQYADIVVPHARELVQEAHRLGLKVIHYFMGNPIDRADLVASVGAEAILFEEARKGYEINIEALADQINGDQVLMGNLAAEEVLAKGSESDLNAEIARLISFGRKRERFMMATGSPPTPETPLTRIKFALDTARQLWKN